MQLKLILLLLVVSFYSVAQEHIRVTEQLISELFEQFSAEGAVELDYTTFYDELRFFALHPINLNRTSREELERLPFLSDVQVENMLAYIYQFGSLKSIFELRLIDGLDMTDIRRLLPFVLVGEGDNRYAKIYWVDVLKYGKQEFICRLDKTAEEKAGYANVLDDYVETPPVIRTNYLGNQLYNSVRYRFHYKDRIQVAFTAEKDAGEPFWGSRQRGYDFYSASVQLNDIGKFKTLVFGDFRANFGQGLVLHPDFALSKSSAVLNVSTRASGLKKYSSTDETNFFRGGGFSCQFGKLDLSAFYSNKNLDADTLNGRFPVWNKTGLHRTLSEFSLKHAVNQQVVGLNADLNLSSLKLGFVLVHTVLDNQLQSEKSIYNHFYFAGSNQTTAGLNYRLRLFKLNLFGETAITNSGAMATINGMTLSPSSQVNLVVLQRNYSPGYDSFYATAFSEASKVNNETGLYLATEIRPFKQWKMVAAVDSYRFPWPKFGLDASSIGQYSLIQLDYNPRSDLSMYWRFKYNFKQTNNVIDNEVFATIVPTQKSTLRYHLKYSVGHFSFKNSFDANFASQLLAPFNYGILFSQDVSYAPSNSSCAVDLRFQFFDADNYTIRFYPYEQDVLYAFSMPMLCGLGSRYYLNLRYNLTKSLSVWFKIAQTVYADDREGLSSGNDRIAGNRKTDLRLLLKYNF
jgi:hypothetical protein